MGCQGFRLALSYSWRGPTLPDGAPFRTHLGDSAQPDCPAGARRSCRSACSRLAIGAADGHTRRAIEVGQSPRSLFPLGVGGKRQDRQASRRSSCGHPASNKSSARLPRGSPSPRRCPLQSSWMHHDTVAFRPFHRYSGVCRDERTYTMLASADDLWSGITSRGWFRPRRDSYFNL